MHLDENQRKAISATEGPVCISAGPGSGKTRVLVERIAHLIEQDGVSPKNILAITFTTKAAREMRERVKERLSVEEKNLPYIGTFHAFAFDLLKEHGERIGIRPDFFVVQKYDEKKCTRETNTLTFDDLIIHAVALLEEHTDVRELYQKKFNRLMVDEYQDTNTLQARLLELLAQKHGNLCVVGDPNQSIYGFRGSDPQHFYNFPRRFPSAAIISLKKNYRSSRTIVQASDALIAHNQNDAPRSLWVEREGDRPIHITHAASASQEAFSIVKTIQELVGGTEYEYLTRSDANEQYHFSDIAVLYRLNAVGRFLEQSFARAALPFVVVGATRFFEHPEIVKILNKLKEMQPGEKIPLSGAIRTIMKKTPLKSVRDRSLELAVIATTYDHLSFPEAREKFFTDAALCSTEDDWYQRQNAITLMSVHAAKGLEFPVVFIAGAEEGLFPYLKEREVRKHGVLPQDLEHSICGKRKVLHCEAMQGRSATDAEKRCRSTFSPVAEFFSRKISVASTCKVAERLAEERRLFYVAMTRAKDRLYISHSSERVLFGKKTSAAPSRLLSEIPDEYVEKKSLQNKKRRTDIQKRLF